MLTTDQKQHLFDAVGQIRAAEIALLEASRSISDPTKLMQINAEYSHLDSYLSQILHTQALADDADFKCAITILKEHANALSSEAKNIAKIIDDAATLAKIAVYISKAAQLLAAL